MKKVQFRPNDVKEIIFHIVERYKQAILEEASTFNHFWLYPEQCTARQTLIENFCPTDAQRETLATKAVEAFTMVWKHIEIHYLDFNSVDSRSFIRDRIERDILDFQDFFFTLDEMIGWVDDSRHDIAFIEKDVVHILDPLDRDHIQFTGKFVTDYPYIKAIEEYIQTAEHIALFALTHEREYAQMSTYENGKLSLDSPDSYRRPITCLVEHFMLHLQVARGDDIRIGYIPYEHGRMARTEETLRRYGTWRPHTARFCVNVLQEYIRRRDLLIEQMRMVDD